MPSEVRLKIFQIYSLFKCLKLSFLGQFLVGGQGQGGHGPYGPPGSATEINYIYHYSISSTFFFKYFRGGNGRKVHVLSLSQIKYHHELSSI